MNSKKDDKQQDKVFNNFEAQFKKSTLPMVTLAMLSEKEMYAYEIMQYTLERSDGKYKMPLLYTTLGKLQEQGYVVESRKEVTPDNRVRIYYNITDAGHEHLTMMSKHFSMMANTVDELINDSRKDDADGAK